MVINIRYPKELGGFVNCERIIANNKGALPFFLPYLEKD